MQRRFDFFRLDANTPNLDPKIFAPTKDQASGRRHLTQITRSINPAARVVRIGKKRRGSQFRLVPIAWREKRAAHDDFANLIRRQLSAVVIMNCDVFVLDLVTNRNNTISEICRMIRDEHPHDACFVRSQ